MARPREFDPDEALGKAMDLFWRQGFEGTSLDALEQSLGMNRSSLYNTFGGKLDLFCRALDTYSAGPCTVLFGPLQNSRGAAALRGYLEVLRGFIQSPEASKGCMMVNTSLEGVSTEAPVHQRVEAHFLSLRRHLRRAYGEGLEDGTVNQSLKADEAADWLHTFVRGVLAGAAAKEEGDLLIRSIKVTIQQLDLSPSATS